MTIHDAIMMASRDEITMVLAMAGRMKHQFTVEEREKIREMMKTPRISIWEGY